MSADVHVHFTIVHVYVHVCVYYKYVLTCTLYMYVCAHTNTHAHKLTHTKVSYTGWYPGISHPKLSTPPPPPPTPKSIIVLLLKLVVNLLPSLAGNLKQFVIRNATSEKGLNGAIVTEEAEPRFLLCHSRKGCTQGPPTFAAIFGQRSPHQTQNPVCKPA